MGKLTAWLRTNYGHKLPWLIGGIAAVAIVVSAVTFFDQRSRSDDAGTYTYELTGTAASVDITMSTDGGTSQQSGAELPFHDIESPDTPYLSAQIIDESGGSVTCTIRDGDGSTVATSTSDGFAAIVTCKR